MGNWIPTLYTIGPQLGGGEGKMKKYHRQKILRLHQFMIIVVVHGYSRMAELLSLETNKQITLNTNN